MDDDEFNAIVVCILSGEAVEVLGTKVVAVVDGERVELAVCESAEQAQALLAEARRWS